MTGSKTLVFFKIDPDKGDEFHADQLGEKKKLAGNFSDCNLRTIVYIFTSTKCVSFPISIATGG